MGDYVFDQKWTNERARLAGIERLWDPGSQAVLETLGVGPSWACVEVGAGGGSMTTWLAARAAHVVAMDLDTRHLEAIGASNVEIRRHDIREYDLPQAGFDLVYARMVVSHIGSWVIPRLVHAVRPGGVLLLEDYDFVGAPVEPPDPLYERMMAGTVGLVASAGWDPLFGRRLPGALRAAGLEGVQSDGRVRVIRGGTTETAFHRLSVEALRGRLVATGALTELEIEQALGRLDDPDRTFLSPVMVAAWGRRRARGRASATLA